MGGGKTSILIRAAVWAILTGRRRYVAIVAATETKAQKLLKSIKTEILHREELKADFAPELLCLVKLGNRAAMAGGQHSNGDLTGVEWHVGSINFGYIDIPERKNTNNAIIVAMGITGDIRGEQTTTPADGIRRPDLVLVDDPQTKRSAGSKSQVQKRHETLMGDVLGMAGPGVSIAGLCACTVIYHNDLSDRLLDREESPEWQGERCKLVYQWPDNEEIWDEFRTMYEDELRSESGHEGSYNFVAENLDEMHRGAVVGWEARYDRKKEISALHSAYILKIRDAGAFAAEYQNEPMEGFEERAFDLNPDDIARRVVPLYRNELPADCETLTATIDIQKEMLYYMICGWTRSGRCYIVNYSTFPEIKRHYFSKREAQEALQELAGTNEPETALLVGLELLTNALCEKEFDRGDTTLMIEKLGIDSGYQTEIVRRFCRESKHKARLVPVRGKYIGANSQKWQQIKFNRKKEKAGVHCKLTPVANSKRSRRELLLDTNFWKTFCANRLAIQQESPRAIVLFQDTAAHHRLIAEHFTAEMPKRVTAKTGIEMIEWDQPKGRDNDWWDTLVYNCALASICGVDTHDPADQPMTQKQSRTNVRGAMAKRRAGDGLTARQRMEKRRPK